MAISRSNITKSVIDDQFLLDNNLVFHELTINDIFKRAFEKGEFDIAELSLTRMIMALDRGTAVYEPLPIFPRRAFRHDCLYVAADGPSDVEAIRGGRIGVERLDQTAVMTVRGILHDQYNIGPGDVKWVVGTIDCHEHGAGSATCRCRTLSNMLIDGSISALISLRPPRRHSTAGIRRLFDAPEIEGQAFFIKFGFVPIMHVIGLHHRVFTSSSGERARLVEALKCSFRRSVQQQAGAEADVVGLHANQAALEKAAEWAVSQGLCQPFDLLGSFTSSA